MGGREREKVPAILSLGIIEHPIVLVIRCAIYSYFCWVDELAKAIWDFWSGTESTACLLLNNKIKIIENQNDY